MIPLPALSAVPWKLVAWGVAALAVAALGWRVSVWRHAYAVTLPEAQEALAAEVACEVPSKCAERVAALQARQKAISETVVEGYERELQELRNRPPAAPVRLCRPARAGNVRPATAPGPADGAAPGGDVPLEASSDIGQRLFDLADAADREALKLKYLQDWNRAMAKQP